MLTLTDINIDCLTCIFEHLNLVDLLNVADSNTWLKSAADVMFTRNYGKKTIWLDLDHQFSHPTIKLHHNLTIIRDLKTCLQIVRCFGYLLNKLQVTGDKFIWSGREMDHIIRLLTYVNKYCSESLNEITFERFSELSLVRVKDAFPNVEIVQFKYCCVEKILMHFNRLFPKTRTLKLLWTDVAGVKLHIPHLEQLEINIPISLNKFQMDNIKAIIRSNPQLRCLKIYFGWNTEFLRNISKHMKSVKRLEIGCAFIGDEHDGDTIQFNGVNHFTLCSNGMTAVPKIIFSFDRIEEFTLETNCWWNEENINLISKHKSITKLIIKSNDSTYRNTINGEIARKMAKALPSLRHISIEYKQFAVIEAKHLLNEFKLLKTLQFTIDNVTHFDGFVQTLDIKWKTHIDDENHVTIMRNI